MATKDTDSPVQQHITRLKDLRAERQFWDTHYQRVAELFLARKQYFTRTVSPGEFLQDEIFSNTPQFAAFLAASMMLSMLMPDASRTFRLRPVRRLRNVAGAEEYFRFATEEVQAAMDNPKAGLQIAAMEYMLEQVVFGTSGIGEFAGPDDDPELPVVYKAWGIRSMYYDEDDQGRVSSLYFVRELTPKQILGKYDRPGDTVSPKVRELAESEKDSDKKLEVLQVITPKKPDARKRGVAAMPLGSVHIDIEHKTLMRRSGFDEMPVQVTRFFKTPDEKYGRSPGMMALPDAASLNALAEAVLVATEKQLDPPLGVLDDGRLGGGVIDTSASALNVFNTSGRIDTRNPIFPLFTVGEMQSADKLLERLERSIFQAFFLDRLLDLNNDVQMTAFETSIRNRMRGEALGSVFARQMGEALTPLIERTFNIMWRRGDLGHVETGIGAAVRRAWRQIIGTTDQVVVPRQIIEAVSAGLNVFEVEYISPAKRFMRSEKLQGIFTASDAIAALAAIYPGITDNIDPDQLAQDIYEFSGAPPTSLRVREKVRELRARAAEQQGAGEALEAADKVADITQKAAQARATLGTAGAPRGRA